MNIIKREFYLSDAILVSKALLGKVLVREVNGVCYNFKIVETEAYMGAEDKASHAYGNKRTKRTEPIFQIGGTSYVYLIYGMYDCFNIVVNEKDIPHAVLIRAVEPVDQLALNFARENRRIASKKIKDLTNGPGKLCKALQITRLLNTYDLTQKGELYVTEGASKKFEIVSAKRVGIDYAEEYKDKEWRFYIKGNAFVSKQASI